MPELGRAALFVSLGLIVYALLAGTAAAVTRRRRLAVSAQNALYAAFGSTLVASAVLAVALASHDFALTYVADHTSRALPTIYALSAFWGGQEGSLLLWLLVLTGYGVVAVYQPQARARLVVWVVPGDRRRRHVLRVPAGRRREPVRDAAAPVDGAGLNPSLQNPYMVAHPPMLYLGYVGLTVPFAFAMGALLSGRTDERWIVATRSWTLLAWRPSASVSCSARTGPTSRSAGAATTPGTRSRTPR